MSDIPIMYSVGVSLRFQGETIPNGSFVDLDDIMYTDPDGAADLPSNRNPRDEALKCVTDLVDYCDAPRTGCGYWYYPSGSRVELAKNGCSVAFQVNRGPNEVI